MPVNILMPALSPTMEKGNLAKWLKKEGDKVKPGDVIAEIETDKATMEYEAIDEGTLAKIVVPEGTQDVPVKAVIAVLAEEGEDVKAAAAGAGTGAPAAKAAPPAKPASAPPPPPKEEGALRARGKRGGPGAGRAASPGGFRFPAGGRRGDAGRAHEPRVLVSAGASAGERGRHRSRTCPGLRSARPRHRARRGSGQVGPGACGSRRGVPCRRGRAYRANAG